MSQTIVIPGNGIAAKALTIAQGTIGMLVNDRSLYMGSDSLVTALRALVADVRTNPKKFFSVRMF